MAGNPYSVDPQETDLRKRFDLYTIPEPNSGCLLWLGAVRRGGYGVLSVNGKLERASSVALSLAGRPLLASQWALHNCDNPGCVEANHLFAGTCADNNADMRAKGRANLAGLELGQRPRLSYCKRGHERSDSNIYVEPSGLRHCRQCRQERDRNRRRAKHGR
jgi:hypothetical protein